VSGSSNETNYTVDKNKINSRHFRIRSYVNIKKIKQSDGKNYKKYRLRRGGGKFYLLNNVTHIFSAKEAKAHGRGKSMVIYTSLTLNKRTTLPTSVRTYTYNYCK
jgi:hypothetical protein